MLESINIFLKEGGVMLFPLFICSFLLVFIVLEKLFFLSKFINLPQDVRIRWEKIFSKNSIEVPPVDKKNKLALLNLILFPIAKELPLSEEQLEDRLQDAFRHQKHRMESKLVFLDTIAGIAPLFGLLGTALGMVKVFSKLSIEGQQQISLLSSGISEALITTIAGLFIGIPALVANNLFHRQIQNLLTTTEIQINKIINKHYSSQNTPPIKKDFLYH